MRNNRGQYKTECRDFTIAARGRFQSAFRVGDIQGWDMKAK
jgi:hypothetical protein